MKSPRVFQRRNSRSTPVLGAGGAADDDSSMCGGSVVVSQAKNKATDQLMRREVTVTETNSSSSYSSGNVEKEELRHEEEEGSCYSGGSEYSSGSNDSAVREKTSNKNIPGVLKAFDFRRVFRKRRKKKKGHQQHDEGDIPSPCSLAASHSSYSSYYSDHFMGGDDEVEEAVAAAEALGHDLEAMGYDLDCESFITKGSSIDPEEERYKPPPKSENRQKKKNRKSKKKKHSSSDDEASSSYKSKVSISNKSKTEDVPLGVEGDEEEGRNWKKDGKVKKAKKKHGSTDEKDRHAEKDSDWETEVFDENSADETPKPKHKKRSKKEKKKARVERDEDGDSGKEYSCSEKRKPKWKKLSKKKKKKRTSGVEQHRNSDNDLTDDDDAMEDKKHKKAKSYSDEDGSGELIKHKARSKKKKTLATEPVEEERQYHADRESDDDKLRGRDGVSLDSDYDDVSLKSAGSYSSIGSLSNPSDVLDQSLRTNTTSKIRARSIPTPNKYGHPASPHNMESLQSLRDIVDLTKKYRAKRTIPPPAMANVEAMTKRKMEKSKQQPTKVLDDEESMAAMSGVGLKKKASKDRTTPVKKPTRSGEKPEGMGSFTSKEMDPPATLDEPQPPVVIEGMSVLLGKPDSLMTRNLYRQWGRDGIESYPRTSPDPPDGEELQAFSNREANAVIIAPPKHSTPATNRTRVTKSTALSSQDLRVSPIILPSGNSPPERQKRAFFGLPLPVRNRPQSYVPRVPNLPRTPQVPEGDQMMNGDTLKNDKMSKNMLELREFAGRRFTLPKLSMNNKDDPIGSHAPFQLPSSVMKKEVPPLPDDQGCVVDRELKSPIGERLKAQLSPVIEKFDNIVQAAKERSSGILSPRKSARVDRFFATVGSENYEEETMAPGQIEVTFNSSVADSGLIPVAKLDPPRRSASLSPRTRTYARASARARGRSPPPPPPPEKPGAAHTIPPSPKNPRRKRLLHRLFKLDLDQNKNEDHKQGEQTTQVVVDTKAPKPILSMFTRNRATVPAPRDPTVVVGPPDVGVEPSENEGTFPNPMGSDGHGCANDMMPTLNDSNCQSSLVISTSFEDQQKSRVLEALNLYTATDPRHHNFARQSSDAPKSHPRKPGKFVRSRSEPVTRRSAPVTDLTTTVQNIVTSVRDHVTNGVSSGQTRGLLDDWFSLDILGNLDWATPTTTDQQQQSKLASKRMGLSEFMSKETLPPQDASFQTKTLPFPSVDQTHSRSNHNRPFGPQPPEPATKAEITEVRPLNLTLTLDTVKEGEPLESTPKRGLLTTLLGTKPKALDDRISTGISSSTPSSFYPVEFNDDNNLKQISTRATLNRPSLSRPSLTQNNNHVKGSEAPPWPHNDSHWNQHQRPPDQMGHRGLHKPPLAHPPKSSSLNSNSAVAHRRLPLSPTVSSPPAENKITKQNFEKSSEIGGDTWAEIADASLVVERAMDRLDSFRSEDTEDPAKLKYLLSVLSDDDTIGDVEKAMGILRKHAVRLGVKETDLLLAVGSHEGSGSFADSDHKSYKSLTFGEEFMHFLNMFIHPPQQKQLK